ncbi:hypothetical protein Pan44_10280 [Caulifigura coniformis]|uniref:Uncharacterized protein n=1 Tax=Caulifigura coniformis TaxID=2527983 RepID=A0A517SA74_9PLAN|nr:hypothetical protein [Caulifigura coniformis]QDT53013.1 hypothetical protein Pan44_10280 [Caulifigura coniformis]
MAKQLDNDQILQQKESEIPHLAAVAVGKAYRNAIASGQKVLVADSGVLYEVTKDGRTPIKNLRPRVRVKVGRPLKLS